jgi:hypothetical protein
MATTPYQEALTHISTSLHAGIADALTKLGPEIAWNIENETALPLDDFVNLLTAFAVELAKPIATVEAWITACRNHTFKGRQVQTPNLPVVLGRVKSFPDHKDAIFKAAGGSIRPLNIEKALKKYADTINADDLPNGFKRALYGAYLGEYTIWATFNFADSTSGPLPIFRQRIAAFARPWAWGI